MLGSLGAELARLVYDGLWFSPLRTSINAFVDAATRPLTGDVKIRLHHGRATVIGRRSPNALYDEALATYGDGDTFSHGSARGFIQLFGLASRVAHHKAAGAPPTPVRTKPKLEVLV